MMRSLGLVLIAIHLPAMLSAQVVKETDPRAHIIVRDKQYDLVVDTERRMAAPFSVKRPDVTLKFLPSGKTIALTGDPQLTTGSFTQFSTDITRDGTNERVKGDLQFEVEVRNLKFSGSEASETLRVRGTVYDSTNVKELVKATSEALAPEKTADEKDLFTGFNIAVPSKDGAVQGDLVFNRTIDSLPARLGLSLADSGSFGVKLKKGTADGKDPRHFNLGFNFRRTKLRASKDELGSIRDAIINKNPTGGLDALNDIRSRFFRAYLFDYGLQMEGDVSKTGLGEVANLITDFKVQIATAAIGFLSEKGFLTLRLMSGTELGRNIANPNKATQEIGSLSRVKGGGELKIYYENNEADSALQRVELNVAPMYRRLFQDEIAYDSKTKTNVSSKRRDMTWTQADLKIFLGGRLGSVRPGLKATFQRGYLPPVFARTKTFTYGLVFESVK